MEGLEDVVDGLEDVVGGYDAMRCECDGGMRWMDAMDGCDAISVFD